MTVTFPEDTYELTGQTSWSVRPSVDRQVMDDGTPVIRTLSSTTHREYSLEFKPMSPSEANALIAYLEANMATEFDLVDIGGGTVRGYIWSDPDSEPVDGYLRRVTCDFYGALQ